MKKHFNVYFIIIGWFLSISFLIGFLLGCSITKATTYGAIPVPDLTDEQLIQEMESIYRSLGHKFDKAQFLMAMMPDPAYVLTSSYTSFSERYNVNLTTYSMPQGYRTWGSISGGGTAYTQYQYRDKTAAISGIILIAQLVNQSKISKLQERGELIVVEYQKRVEEKRENVEKAIEEFFVREPELREKKTLIAAILPWVASDKTQTFQSYDEMLDYTGKIAKGLQTEESRDTWFGTFSQINHFPDGTTTALSNFVIFRGYVSETVLTGRGDLGTGEVCSIQAMVKDGKFEGVVTNETAGVTLGCTGFISDTEFTVSYKGFVSGRQLEGTAVLLR